MTTGEIKFNEIETSNIDNRGIYAWYVELPNEILFPANRINHLKKIVELFDSRIELQGTSSFKNYNGIIESVTNLDITKFDLIDVQQYDLLREAIKVFLPPLYIGKTQNSISSRLKKHVQILNKVSVSNLDKDDNAFKSQLMHRLNLKQIDKSWLYVKYVTLDGNVSFGEDVELKIEYILNRIFNPVLGRN